MSYSVSRPSRETFGHFSWTGWDERMGEDGRNKRVRTNLSSREREICIGTRETATCDFSIIHDDIEVCAMSSPNSRRIFSSSTLQLFHRSLFTRRYLSRRDATRLSYGGVCAAIKRASGRRYVHRQAYNSRPIVPLIVSHKKKKRKEMQLNRRSKYRAFEYLRVVHPDGGNWTH